MSETLDTDAVFKFMQEELARHSLQNNNGELRHIRRVAAFLARVAEGVGDSANQARFVTLFDVATQAMNSMGR